MARTLRRNIFRWCYRHGRKTYEQYAEWNNISVECLLAKERADKPSGSKNAPRWRRVMENKKYRRKNNQKLAVDKEEFEPVEWKRSANWLWF